jgi:hypothetical protein
MKFLIQSVLVVIGLVFLAQEVKCATLANVLTGELAKAINQNRPDIIKINYPSNYEQNLILAAKSFLSGSNNITLPLGSTPIPYAFGAYIAYSLVVPIDNPIPNNNIINNVNNLINWIGK